MDWEEFGLGAAMILSPFFAAWAVAKGLEEATWSQRRLGLMSQTIHFLLVGEIFLYVAFLPEPGFSSVCFGVAGALYNWFAWRYWKAYRSMA